MLRTKAELHDLIRGLRVPEARRAIVEQELLDHLQCRIEVELSCGASEAEAEQVALAALGDPQELRAALERVEPAFALTPQRAAIAGIGSGVACGIVFLIAQAVLPETSSVLGDLLQPTLVSLIGLPILWALAPRGLGATLMAEARAASQPRNKDRPRPTQVTARYYGFGLFALPTAGSFLESFRFIGEGMSGCMSFGPLFIVLGLWALRETARARTLHGA